MFSIEGCNSLRPDGGDVVPLMELPVKGKDSVEIQSQTAAVIHHQPQFLPLKGCQKEAHRETMMQQKKLQA